MKVLILSISDLGGGAARAAYRLHQGLLAAGVDSQMLVQNKVSGDSTVIAPKSKVNRGIAAIKPALDGIPFALHRDRDPTINIYSAQWLPNKIVDRINQINPDIINLHWVCGGFVPIEALKKINKPLVWTLHDMWAFTGGCHYSGKCDRYQDSCGACPQLGSSRNWDLSRWIWQRKAKAWQDLNLTIITPSQWLAEAAKSSSLFSNISTKVIGNGIDPQIYQPHPQELARKILNLPLDRKIILFGALDSTQDRRKGFSLLLSALQELQSLESSEVIELVIFGASAPSVPIDFGFQARYVGKLNDDISLSLLYGAADVFVAPSIQDNLPNTILEAIFCGTPCAAFNIGGIPDMVQHQHNGYLAQPFLPEDLARGIHWILKDPARYQELAAKSRDKAISEFALDRQSQKYLRVFHDLCSKLSL
ncbi:glycosyltransferase family 4 protein [Waterburya agarophytonicola K14]|uniref:Glycosyltransferase family 4 protein n=1 Tax=Waterburya agarophytonicola KI4 TaxID=2874699 RepID=A0A964FGU4_9CYAN|nr:glycosyltransferase family 4 protein [Waterburya agarophytonicola]MCC0179335.1 glycosyltransferase family 4 protein [Waterburya agarophytonicola KI4]